MIRWGFLGAGYVASRAMAPAVHAARGAVLQAVASGDQRRSASLEPRTVSGDYRGLLDDPDVDAVYISLTNAQHLQWVVAALQAGKHVLCEKPLGVSAADVAAMAQVAEHHDRLLVEAAWVRWHPRMRRLVDVARRGDLGAIESFDSAFTFENSDPDNYRWSPTWGGGALLDVGCYQAQVWTAVTGTDVPVTVARVERHSSASGVDATTEAEVRIGAHIAARLECSFERPPLQRLVIVGSDQRLETLDGEAFTSWRETSSLRIGDTIETFEPIDAFVSMVEAVSARIHGDESWVVPIAESLRTAQILDDIASS